MKFWDIFVYKLPSPPFREFSVIFHLLAHGLLLIRKRLDYKPPFMRTLAEFNIKFCSFWLSLWTWVILTISHWFNYIRYIIYDRRRETLHECTKRYVTWSDFRLSLMTEKCLDKVLKKVLNKLQQWPTITKTITTCDN